MTTNNDTLAPEHLLSMPAAGGLWRHYKGGVYKVVFSAMLESTLQALVVYANVQTKMGWARPLSEWHEEVAPGVRRFAPIADPDQEMP